MQETWVWALGREDALEEETATHSSILAWEIPTEEPSLASYTPWGHKELTMTERWLSDTRRTTTSTIPVWDGCLGVSRKEEQKEKNREERWASRREEGKRKSWNSTRLVRHRVPPGTAPVWILLFRKGIWINFFQQLPPNDRIWYSLTSPSL